MSDRIRGAELGVLSGFSVGHAQDLAAGTGVTVVVAREGAVGGVAVRGGAPATRETDLLAPENTVDRVDAVCLSGGSAYGLSAADGVMTTLEDAGHGLDVMIARVPIVCGASLFDLGVGSASVRPDAALGAEATSIALEGWDTRTGNVGAGTGATVGKLLMMQPGTMMKGGLGQSAFQLGELTVVAVVAVNAVGYVVDPGTGTVLAGVLDPVSGSLMPIDTAIEAGSVPLLRTATTIGVVMTNGILTKAQATKVASIAHDGIARTIIPAHTTNDGDALFALSSGSVAAPTDLIAHLATRAVEAAIVNAIVTAESAYGLLAHADLPTT